MNKWAVIATDRNPVYEFFAPITAAMWRSRVGYEALLFCIGTESEWSVGRSGVVLHALRELGTTVEFIAPLEGYRTANLAQVVRLYGFGSSVVGSSDYLVLSDVDMWPVSGEWFRSGEADPGGAALLYANNLTRFAICYVGAHADTWRTIMVAADQAGTPEELAHDHLRAHLHPSTAAADAWQHDEDYLTQRIHAWPGFPDRCKQVRRADGEPPTDRIDRSAWPKRVRLTESIVDAHLVRPGHERWADLTELVRLAAPTLHDWACRYAEAYRGA